ncbi:kininogen-1 isoform X1 [Dipodomys merriami]|uniref:kininogen-1 isoform X1 n=1 Tax=Dipodomys merriami TaxID=94247 RepID=UPI003855A1A3
MKLLTILLLCSRLLPSLTQDAVFQETDCNDEDVFKAVDAALQNYNKRNQTGNQFLLYRVTEVNKTVSPQLFYSVKYEIKEGNCPVESGKTWQDCEYQEAENAATGECSATVGKRESEKFSVATQTCQITPANGPVMMAQYNCRGCVHPISTNNPDLDPVLKHAIEHFNNNTQHSHLFALGEVKSAQRQVVAGLNFEIIYTILQTNCSKENFLFLTEDCKTLSNGDAGECTDHAFVNIHQRIASFQQNCELYPAEDESHVPLVCVGCPKEIPVDSPQLEEALTHSIEKLNAENNATFYFTIETVKRATSQVVAGIVYSIDFLAKETECSKETSKFSKSCEPKKIGQQLSCHAQVYVVSWEKKIEATVICQPLGMIALMKRPPGFSPFRSGDVQKTGKETTVSPPYTSMVPVQDEEQDPENEQGPTHGHDWDPEKQIKHETGHDPKHKHDQGHSHHGLGHGHKRKHGHDHELNQYNLKHQRGHSLGHEHQMGHDLANGHRHKHKHGHDHGKHKHKGKKHGKHSDWKTEPLASSSEDSTTSSQTPEKTEGPAPIPSLAQPEVAVTSSGFQDSDLLEAWTTIIPTAPTENDDDWIPDIQIEPDSFSFKLISDFPETSSPKCPGRPWKPVNGKNPTMEVKELDDFDLIDALS